MRGKIEATIKHKGGENFGNGSVARHILRLALHNLSMFYITSLIVFTLAVYLM